MKNGVQSLKWGARAQNQLDPFVSLVTATVG